MHKIFTLDKKLLYLSFVIIIIISLSFLLLAVTDSIRNEAGLILAILLFAGISWVILYFLLPFDILFGTNTSVGVLRVLMIMLPVYINVYLLLLLIQFMVEIGIIKNRKESNSIENR